MPQLDYSQLHRSGWRRKIDRSLASITQDHEYCMKTPSIQVFDTAVTQEEISEGRPDMELNLFQNSVGKAEMENILGSSLSDWEKDPELAERMQSLGEVLGLAKDLNISIDGLSLGEDAGTQMSKISGSSDQFPDMPVIEPDFWQISSNTVTDENSKSLQQEAKSTSQKKVTSQTEPKTKSSRRESLQVKIVRGRKEKKGLNKGIIFKLT